MSKFARVSSRLFNAPLMLRPEKAEMLCAALVDRLGIAKLDRIDGTSLGAAQLRQQASDWYDEKPKTPRDMYTVSRGVARIPINGTLVHKLGGVEPWSGMIGYDQLDQIIGDAQDNKDVGALLLDIDSPGGEVAGCFDLARKLAKTSARGGGKPIIGAANEMACSAAYALISACDEVYMPETGIAGSIGVWTLLVDMTQALDKGGIEVTMIRAGERKARGGPYEQADEATVAKLLDWVEETRQQFAALVAEHRSISVDAVLDQEGDWFPGDEAMDRGLVDGIGPFEAISDRARVLANA